MGKAHVLLFKIGVTSILVFLSLFSATAAAVTPGRGLELFQGDLSPGNPPSVSTISVSGITNNSAVLSGNLGSMGSAAAVNVSFDYGRTTTYGFTTTAKSLTASGGFTVTLNGLNPGSAYHFRAKADGGTYGVAYGSDMTFTTGIPPAVSTLSATNIKSYSSTLNGNLTYMGNSASVNVYFVYGTTTGYESNTASLVLSTTGYFSINITGLSPGTTYHFQAKADGGVNGITSGMDGTLFTTPVYPSVASQAPSSISFTSVTMRGNLLNLGNASSASVYFEYGTTTAYGSTTGGQTFDSAPSPYSVNVTGLTPGTMYHYRAKVDAGKYGVATGEDEVFTTQAGQSPQLGMTAVNNITVTSATLIGNLASLGTATSISVYFEYGTTTTYGTTATASTPSGTGYNQGGFSTTITDLEQGTEYHFRAVVDAGAYGKYYSDDMTFTTLGTGVQPVPSVSTIDSGSVTAASAVLNGTLTSLGSSVAVDVYFEYGTSTSYGTIAGRQSVNKVGPFSVEITGLKPGTLYHFHAVVDDRIANRDYGVDKTFTTSTLPPSARSLPAENITSSSATVKGTLVSLGTAGTVDAYFEYGTSTNYGYTIGRQTLTAPTAADKPITVDIPSLIPDTTYHFRIKVDAGVNGVATGDDETFTTKAVAAINVDGGSLTITPTEVTAGQNVTIGVKVNNPSNVEGTYKVSLMIDGSVEDSQQVIVPAASSKQVTFTVNRSAPGLYQVDINGLTGSFTVTAGTLPTTTATGNTPNSTPNGKPISNSMLFIIIVLAVIVVVGAAILLIRYIEKRKA